MDLSHSTLHVLRCLLERPTSEWLTCSGGKGSSSALGCPEGFLHTEVSDPFSPWSLLVDLEHVTPRACRSPSEWLSGVVFWFGLWARWLDSIWGIALSGCCMRSELCLCGGEWGVCSWESRVLSWLREWLWRLFFSQKALRCCSNSESRGRPMSRCISRLSSHSSSFEKEGLTDKELWRLEVVELSNAFI